MDFICCQTMMINQDEEFDFYQVIYSKIFFFVCLEKHQFLFTIELLSMSFVDVLVQSQQIVAKLYLNPVFDILLLIPCKKNIYFGIK